MSITLGTATVNGDQVIITPPVGQFGGIEAVRLTNYTSDVLILTNLDENRPGQEYLMPFQQMVYRQINVRNPPQVAALLLGNDFDTSTLLVEWSSEGNTDFPGTYPVNLQTAPIAGVAAPFFSVHEIEVPDDGTTYVIPANSKRTSITVYNDGSTGTANDVNWAMNDNSWPRPILEAGGARTLATQQAIYFRGTGSSGDTAIQYFQTFYGAADIT